MRAAGVVHLPQAQRPDADADDVQQNVWLQLVSQLDTIRNPATLPGWLATTTRRECGRVLRAARDHWRPGMCPDEMAW